MPKEARDGVRLDKKQAMKLVLSSFAPVSTAVLCVGPARFPLLLPVATAQPVVAGPLTVWSGAPTVHLQVHGPLLPAFAAESPEVPRAAPLHW